MDRRVFLFGASAALGATRVASAQSGRQLTLGLTSHSATDWPLYVAEKLGFFAANDLKLDEIVIGSSAGCAQQLTAGSIDIGSVSSTQIIEAVIGGAPLIEVMSEVVTAPYFLLARKGITSVAGLKGKTIIVGGPNDITRVFTDKILTANGVKPEETTYTFAGATSDRFAALFSGSVDAARLLPPFAFRAAAAGYPVVAEMQKYIPTFSFGGLAARIDWAKSHRDLIMSFDKSYLQGVHWLYDPANRARALQVLQDVTNTTPDDAAKTYDLYVTRSKLFSADGRFADADFAKVLGVLQATNQIAPPYPPPSRYFDNSYAEAAMAQLRASR
jgi:NitT/TauT family transport system substrate-binding protein